MTRALMAALACAVLCAIALAPADDEHAGISNVYEVVPGVWSGSQPYGEGGFDALAQMGVRTVISVDGADPDLALAHERGMRYVHIPIGYDKVPTERAKQIAAALKDLPQPIYVHCHHGKHRGPSAVVVGLVGIGRLTPDEAVDFMQRAGTSDKYKGLYRCASEAVVLEPGDLPDGESLPEIAPVPGFVAAMAQLDRTWDHIKEIRAAGWDVPAHHPDLVPAAEAGRAADLLRVLAADRESIEEGAVFVRLMEVSARDASALEAAIIEGAPAEKLEALFTEVTASCIACHQGYRN